MYQTRLATPEDAATLAAQRRRMSLEEGRADTDDLRRSLHAFEPWAADMLRQGKYIGWLALHDDKVIGGAGLWVQDWPPCALDPAPYRGYLLNVYVDPEHRRKGLARTMIGHALAEARRRSIRVLALHATETGQSLYTSLGFQRTNEMYYVDRAAE